MGLFGKRVVIVGKGRRPDPPADLAGYAQSRGLTWTRETALRPWSALYGAEEGDNLNTIRGVLPSGVRGVLGHRVTGMRTHAGETTAKRTMYSAETYAAVLVPETKATLTAVEARGCDGRVDYADGVPLLDSDGDWMEDDRSVEWTVGTGRLADQRLWAEIWDGPLGARVRASYPGGRLDVRAGIVSLWAPGFVTDPGALDALAHDVTEIATGIREHCLRSSPPPAWDTALPAPATWQDARNRHDDLGAAINQAIGRVWMGTPAAASHIFDPGAAADDEIYAGVCDFAVTYAQARGLTLEDGRSFDRAFGSVPLAGWTLCAWRDGARRLVLTAQRPVLPSAKRAVGALAVVGPVADGTPDHDLVIDEPSKVWTQVSAGLRVAWVTHATLDLTHARLDERLG